MKRRTTPVDVCGGAVGGAEVRDDDEAIGADGRAWRRSRFTAFTPSLLLLAMSRTPIQVVSSRRREASQPEGGWFSLYVLGWMSVSSVCHALLVHVHTKEKTTIVRLKIDCKEQDNMEWDFLIPLYEECHVSPMDGVMSGASWTEPYIDDC